MSFVKSLPILVLMILPLSALAQFQVVLKNGQVIKAKSKPVSMEGSYRFKTMSGEDQVIPVQQVDVPATEAANFNVTPQSKPRRVITNEDLGGTESSAGEKAGGSPSSAAGNPAASGPPRPAAASGASPQPAKNDLSYWQGRAKKIRDEISATEARINELNNNVAQKKTDGITVGMGTYTPYMVVGNYQEELQKLNAHKQKLERDLAELEDEARKAGIPPGALR